MTYTHTLIYNHDMENEGPPDWMLRDGSLRPTRYFRLLQLLALSRTGLTSWDVSQAFPGIQPHPLLRRALEKGHARLTDRVVHGHGRPSRVYEAGLLPLDVLSFYYSEGDEL